jgi:hypothetical protein
MRLAELGDITRHFTAAGRMADVDGVPQVEMLDHGVSVGCVVIHVIARVHLCGAAMTAPVMRYDAVAMC